MLPFLDLWVVRRRSQGRMCLHLAAQRGCVSAGWRNRHMIGVHTGVVRSNHPAGGDTVAAYCMMALEVQHIELDSLSGSLTRSRIEARTL